MLGSRWVEVARSGRADAEHGVDVWRTGIVGTDDDDGDAVPALHCEKKADPVTDHQDRRELEREVLDQSVDERDPADDSGEADDPTAMVEAYPQVFDDRIAEAEQALERHRAADGGAETDR